MIGVDMLSFLLFLVVVGLFIYRERKKIEFQGIALMRRTKRGKKLIDRLAKPKTFWKWLSYLGIGIGFLGMAVITYGVVSFFYNMLVSLVSGQVVTPPGSIVLPTYATQTVVVPGAIFIPWYRWLIAISLIVIPHEFFHGIMARVSKINIKSLGWGLFLFFIPVAFVEPDEKQLKKSSLKTKLRVFSAGSFANLLVFLLFLGLFLGFSQALTAGHSYAVDSQMVEPSGVYFGSYVTGETYPAERAEMLGAITEIGDYQVRTVGDISRAMSNYQPGDQVEVMTTQGVYKVTLAQSPDNSSASFLGIAAPFRTNYKPRGSYGGVSMGLLAAGEELSEIFFLVYMFSFFVGLINLLPVVPLDGGLMARAVRDSCKGPVGKFFRLLLSVVTPIALIFFAVIIFFLLNTIFAPLLTLIP